ncbi:DUF3849 domain-containing protein [Faecalibacterium sp. An192]|uniref:DUF3849 domain-containing protein n=1 Tax=Faecalibacterium sp. An192 TaxID=1965581 RepID=UPI000B383E00|nr:DUF3849 domain-containing protein [Faecalibacterium sp. An192]OUP27869.1 hypothetical protein B5F27_08695 [Faecalibacterium sp. An192]
MTDAELNTALYKKMFAEQEQFKDWLLTQPPEKILEHSYKYSVREDFILALEYDDLTRGQAAALLASPTPLDDLFHTYESTETHHMEEVWSCLESLAEYRKAERAVQEERINISCKEAIEGAIDGNYKGNSLDAKAAAQEVLDQFGPERVQTVLAATIKDKDWDGRFSCENKAWAQTVPMQEGGENRNRRSHWVVDSHPGLVNLLVDQVRDMVREREKEKPSVIQQLRQESAAGKIKAAPPKKRETER